MPFKTGNWGDQAKARSSRRKEYFRNYQKHRSAEKREIRNLHYKQYYKQNSEKFKAQYLARCFIDIPQGQLCEECNKVLATQRHHPDYSKPLVVAFLCSSCHRKKK